MKKVSTVARRLTGAFFSQEALPFVSPSAGTENADYECDAQGLFHFFVLMLPGERARLQFTLIDGQVPFDITTIDTPPGYSALPTNELPDYLFDSHSIDQGTQSLSPHFVDEIWSALSRKFGEGFQPRPIREVKRKVSLLGYEFKLPFQATSPSGLNYPESINVLDEMGYRSCLRRPDGPSPALCSVSGSDQWFFESAAASIWSQTEGYVPFSCKKTKHAAAAAAAPGTEDLLCGEPGWVAGVSHACQ